MASVVARALVTVDAEKASKQDLELLKKLVMEFKDELDALGVKVDSLDKRVAVLEENLGGWKLGGQFWFDANFAGGDQANSNYTEGANDNSFQKTRFRLTLQKQISETTSFYAQFRAGSESAGTGTSGLGDISQINVREIYVDTLLPWDINFRVGRFFVDFEADHGLYVDNDAIFGDYRVDGFQLSKTWSSFSAKAVIARNVGNEWNSASVLNAMGGEYYGPKYGANEDQAFSVNSGYMNYALDLTWQPTANFFLGVNGNWFIEDSNNNDPEIIDMAARDFGGDFSTYGVYASYNFTPAVKLQGTYYFQDIDEGYLIAGMASMNPLGDATEDNPQAWRATLDLGQDLLKFTGLRFEYQEQDNTFVGVRNPYTFDKDTGNAASVSDNMPWNDGTTKFFFVYAPQKWNDKWSSYLRYTHADFDSNGLDDADSYGIGITYQYTPAIAFRLAYDYTDYGDNNPTGFYSGDDHVIQFRTAINF